jgi:uncharacterized membrane protein YdbT with pleckstrin-like domain
MPEHGPAGRQGPQGTICAMVGPQLELMPGERMVLHSHPHWWYFWKQVATGGGLLVLFFLGTSTSGTIATALGWVTLAAGVLWLADTIYKFARWQTTRFAVTSERVAYQSGLIRRRGVSIPLNRINNVNFDQTLIERMLNNGVVTIESAGETGDSVFQNIPDPEQVRSAIFQQIQADEEADSQRDAAALAEAMHQRPAGGGSGPSAPERLRQLDQLRADGLISDEEYSRKRVQILEDL